MSQTCSSKVRAMRWLFPCWALLLVTLPGCAAYRTPNARLEHYDPDYGYRQTAVLRERPLGDVLLVLAFSGGGTRAAALSYGVLQELRDTRVVVDGVEKRLLDEVDMISSVSGGSFTSAYYGLFGERIFTDFESVFLRRNLERQLILALFNPLNWLRMATDALNRSDLAIRLYDHEIFERKTFADLLAARGPFLHINAADIVIGDQFTFFQPQFDLICSDLSRLEVARAVAASSAVPGPFSPISLRSWTGQCGYRPPDWFAQALHDQSEGARRRRHVAEQVESYLDSKRSYVHLVDGGVADNLGLRGPLEAVTLVGGIRTRFDQLGINRPAHIAVIVVNAEVHPDPPYSLTAAGPGLAALVAAVSGAEIYSYNFETLELLHTSMKKWGEELTREQPEQPVQTHIAEIAFAGVADPVERQYLNNLPTSFSLDETQVDRLIAVGRRELRRSPEFQDLLRQLASP